MLQLLARGLGRAPPPTRAGSHYWGIQSTCVRNAMDGADVLSGPPSSPWARACRADCPVRKHLCRSAGAPPSRGRQIHSAVVSLAVAQSQNQSKIAWMRTCAGAGGGDGTSRRTGACSRTCRCTCTCARGSTSPCMQAAQDQARVASGMRAHLAHVEGLVRALPREIFAMGTGVEQHVVAWAVVVARVDPRPRTTSRQSDTLPDGRIVGRLGVVDGMRVVTVARVQAVWGLIEAR